MHQLRKPTTIERVTVDLQARLIVDAEYDAPVGAIRRVRLLTPPAPIAAIAIDTPTPNEAGPGRSFAFVNLPPGFVLPIYLQPQQAIYAMAVPGEGGFALLGCICEFFDEEPPL